MTRSCLFYFVSAEFYFVRNLFLYFQTTKQRQNLEKKNTATRNIRPLYVNLGGVKSFLGCRGKHLFGRGQSILGFNIGFNIGLNIRFNIEVPYFVQYWVQLF